VRLDDLARRAAAEVRRRAEDPALDLEGWRGRRARRDATLVGALAIVLVAGIVVGSLIGPDAADEVAVETTLPPDQVITTTTVTTKPGITATTVPDDPGPALPASILGAGWEELPFGPLTGGRYRMATAWTDDDRLFLWGGHLRYSQEAPASSEFLQDGYLFDQAAGEWTATGSPAGLCQLGLARAIPVEGAVILHGSTSVRGAECALAARYDLGTGEWSTIDTELFRRISSRTALANTGDLLVAPTVGLAYDLGSGETVEVPQAPQDANEGVHSPLRAHWTESEVLALGSDALYSWVPGEDVWTDLPGPPIPDRARDSVLTDAGLLAVNYQMAAAFLRDGEWERPADLPLRFYECLPEPVSAGGTPVVRMCSGIAIWDEWRGTWVPVPLEDLTSFDLRTLVGAPDALYSVGRTLKRFVIERDENGAIVPPATIPIGVMQLDVPEGWEFVESFAPVQDPEGFIPEDETIGVVFSRGTDLQCAVSSTYGGRAWSGTEVGPIAVDRPGRTMLEGTTYRDGSNLTFVFPDDNGSDWVAVSCTGRGDQVDLLSDAATEFAVGLWSPWEEEPAELEGASLIVTPQAGPSGTHVTLDARGFPVDWSEWWLIDEDGTAVAEIPSDFFPHDNPDFALVIAIDVSRAAGIGAVKLPPGTYRFAIDGRVVPDATFTKLDGPPLLDVTYQYDPLVGITDLSITNRGGGPAYLSDWWIVDEIPGSLEYLLPRSTLDPDGQLIVDEGETLTIHLVRDSACEPGELLEEEPLRLTYCGDPAAPEGEGDSLAVRSVQGGDLVDRVFIGKACDPGADDPYCGFATFEGFAAGTTFRIRIPDDVGLPEEVGRWHLADYSLTPNLAGPTEVLSLGTYPLRQGGDRCAQIPENALEDLGRLDAFVSVQRRGGGAAGAFSPRPTEFTYQWLDRQEGAGFWDCLDRADVDELYLRWGSFAQGGDQYYVIVALGQDAHATVRAQQALDILNGLEFGG
jgi:hypothetical protein